jgi:hypothetical protein|tara:strand:+ start:9554 stop:10534 length:981 start_codon:yes stop_codon:yes gene_type:complete
MTDLRSFTYTYSATAESASNPAADVDVCGDAAALTDDEFYMLLDGGMATAGDGDGVCTSQSVTGQVAINGADSEEKNGIRRVNYGRAAPRRVSLASGSDNSSVTITIKGKDGSGTPVTEDVTGPAASASVYTANLYSVVELIYSDIATTALTVGDNAGYVDLGSLCRQVNITSDGNSTAITFTVTGLDVYGNVQSEDITGPSSATATGSSYFRFVSSIKASGSDSNSVSGGVVAGIRIMINNQDTRLKNWYMVQAANAAKAEITMENGATSSASGATKMVFNPGQGDGVVNYPSIGGSGIRFPASMSFDMAVDTDLLTSATFMFDG